MSLGSIRAKELRDSRVGEFFYLNTDPLLTDITKYEDDSEKFVEGNSIENNGKFSYSSLPGIENEKQYLAYVTRIVSKNIHIPPRDLKRRATSDEVDQQRKMMKIARSDRNYAYFGRAEPVSQISSLKTLKEVVFDETSEYLNHDIADLDILSVPESYPTKPHSVSPLAELYYLTQTLPLVRLLPGCHKALLTENFESALLEGKIAVLYSRIEELKRQGKWSLRQMKKYKDPFKIRSKKTTHWLSLLEEAKWMSVDFKESSKYKKACCFEMARGIVDYWTNGKSICIRRKPIIYLSDQEIARANGECVEEENTVDGDGVLDINDDAKINGNNGDTEISDRFKRLDEDSVDDVGSREEIKTEGGVQAFKDAKSDFSDQGSIDVRELLGGNKDSNEILSLDGTFKSEALGPFNLNFDINTVKKLDQSIIKNLPKIGGVGEDFSASPSKSLRNSSDLPIEPISRLLYPYEDDNWNKIVLRRTDTSKHNKPKGPPEYQRGLFGTQYHRRFNYLKPPKPPLIKNIEYRTPTIWLPKDDRYLIHYVAEFCFNWELISEHLSSSASTLEKYESNIERRTPWQCFERYIQLNEKFQFSDMKGVYAYQAQQWLEKAHRAQSTTKRRISPLGVGNESIQRGHRRLRWASMFDAIRKCMKKREIARSKISQRNSSAAANNSSTQTTNETSSNPNSSSSEMAPAQKKPSDKVPTPTELSRLKFERDKSIQEAYINQQATRTRMMAAVAQQKQQQQPSQASSGSRPQISQSTLSTSSSSNNTNQSMSSNSVASNSKPNFMGDASQQNQQIQQNRPPQGQAPGLVKRPTTPNGTPYTAEQIQQLLQYQKQRRLLQQQQQQRPPQQSQSQLVDQTKLPGNSAPNAGIALNKGMLNPNISQNTGVSQQSQGQGQGSSSQQWNSSQQAPTQHTSTDSTSAKRIHFAPAQVSAIINSIQTKNPELSKEQVTKLAATYLANIQQQQQNRLQQQRQQQQQQQPIQSSQQQSQLQQQKQRQVQQGSMGNMGLNMQPRMSQPTQKQPQIATLTPQERKQLQMLKAAKTAQQHQLQQQQLQQKQQQQQQQQQQAQFNQVGQHSSPQMTQAQGSPSLDSSAMSKYEYEQRKKLLIQKHQQSQRMAASNPNMSVQGSPISSPSPAASTSSYLSSLNNSSNMPQDPRGSH